MKHKKTEALGNLEWRLDKDTTVKWLRNGLFEFHQNDQVVVLTAYQLQTVLNRSEAIIKKE